MRQATMRFANLSPHTVDQICVPKLMRCLTKKLYHVCVWSIAVIKVVRDECDHLQVVVLPSDSIAVFGSTAVLS